VVRLEDGGERARVVCIAKVARVGRSNVPGLWESHEREKENKTVRG